MKRFICICIVLVCATSVRDAAAVTIFESGTLGPTGIPWDDVESQSVLGANISMFAYNGVRFHLNQPVISTEIGGHFVAPAGGTFFGAIISLNDEDDFPDSGNLSTPDVLGHTLLTFPSSSDDVFGDLSLSLDAGWYALVFGSGLFEATGSGAALLNNPDIDSPQYIGHQPLSDSGWGNLVNPIFRNFRFVVQGHVVPEPAAIGLMTAGLFCTFFFRTAKHR